MYESERCSLFTLRKKMQARVLLGMTADEVAPLKEAPDPEPYEALLERVAWGEWLLRVQSRTQCAALPGALLLVPLQACLS